MAKIAFIFVLISGFILEPQGWAQDNSIRLRPSYKSVFSECARDYFEFRDNLFLDVYVGSIVTSASAIDLSGRDLQILLSAGGVNPKLYLMLHSESFDLALRDCVPSQSARNALVAELLAIDGIGKLVGISIGGLTWVGGTKIFKYIFFKLAQLSPTLALRAFVSTAIIGSAFTLWKLKQQYFEEDLVNQPSNDITFEWKKKFVEQGRQQLESISIALAQPGISESDKQKLQKQKDDWEVALKKVT